MPRNIYRYLDADGDGGGDKNCNVDGSETPVVRKFVADQLVTLHRAIITVRDDGVWTAEKFGAIADGLANGCEFELIQEAVVNNLLDGLTIKTNADWGRLCNLDFVSIGAGMNTSLCARWPFSIAGVPLILNTGDSFQLRIRDDLTSLVEFFVQLQGYNDSSRPPHGPT